jgi:uncharacterized protein YjiS (DUF1127 family)
MTDVFGFDRLIATFRRTQVRRLAIADLRRLSDAQLRDLGLPPDGLQTVVDEMLERPAARPQRPAGKASGNPHAGPAFQARLSV